MDRRSSMDLVQPVEHFVRVLFALRKKNMKNGEFKRFKSIWIVFRNFTRRLAHRWRHNNRWLLLVLWICGVWWRMWIRWRRRSHFVFGCTIFSQLSLFYSRIWSKLLYVLQRIDSTMYEILVGNRPIALFYFVLIFFTVSYRRHQNELRVILILHCVRIQLSTLVSRCDWLCCVCLRR